MRGRITIVSSVDIPQTYYQAILELKAQFGPIIKKIKIIRVKKIYKLVDQLVGRNVIGLKWVFALKFDGVGLLYERKAQVVIQKFIQV